MHQCVNSAAHNDLCLPFQACLCVTVCASASLWCVGASDYHLLDVAGAAVDDVNTAQDLAHSGTVVISPAAWDKCDKRLCIARLVGEGYAQVRQSILEPGYSQ